MGRPLYKKLHEASLTRQATGNAGLWFERFFDGYNTTTWQINDAQEKNKWLQTFNGHVGNKDALKQAALEQHQLSDLLNGRANVFKADWHFVTGMGSPHPVENGLLWHPTFGTPYLSGSGVKGLVRAWIELSGENTSSTTDQLLQWFGSDNKDVSADDTRMGTGDLIFFDAIPIEPVQLTTDIMTPHMGKWYESGDEITNVDNEPDRVPADWHDPTPIPFLVVQNAQLLFSVAPRNNSGASQINLDDVMDAIKASLAWLGAGAKTSSGYGYMSPIDNSWLIEEVEESAQLARKQSMSPQELALDELKALLEQEKTLDRREAGGVLAQQLQARLKEAVEWSFQDRSQLAQLGAEIYGYLGWGSGKKKQQRKALIQKLLETE